MPMISVVESIGEQKISVEQVALHTLNTNRIKTTSYEILSFEIEKIAWNGAKS